MEIELSEDKKAAQIRELTRLVISLRDEVHKKQSGFFNKSQPEPIPPELEFNDSKEKPTPVENTYFSGFDFDQLSSDLSPLMRVALFLPTTTFEHVWSEEISQRLKT